MGRGAADGRAGEPGAEVAAADVDEVLDGLADDDLVRGGGDVPVAGAALGRLDVDEAEGAAGGDVQEVGDLAGTVVADEPAVRVVPGDPVEIATQLIIDGAAGAVFVGRMEYGPRALGARSIVASPSDQTINDRLNKRLDRSEFMPFAPYVLEEDAERVFEITPVNRYAARFMTITCAVRPEWRARIPAVVHVDNTARPQIVREADNPLFARILRRFRDRTGIPVLINTSFNVHEEPIVNRPEECRRALVDGRVDFVVTKQAVYVTSRGMRALSTATGAASKDGSSLTAETMQ